MARHLQSETQRMGAVKDMQAGTKQSSPVATIQSCYSAEAAESFVRSKPPSQQAAPGVVFAKRYILDRKLGAGGMGSVWLAYDQSLQNFCALKVLHEQQALDDEVRTRFRREAAVAARIRSENVVSILEHGDWEGQPYIAMEYLEGEDLGSRLSRIGKLDVQRTCLLLLQLAHGLDGAHRRGIIHRDIKPANVLLASENGDDMAKLVDFGVAKEVTYSRKGGLTEVGAFLGTPAYASPEQLRGRDVDYRSDLWSLAVLAYECLTGCLPFDDESLAGTCANILHGSIPSLCATDPSLPPALDAWWYRATARDPNQRYQSVQELADGFAGACRAAGARASSPKIDSSRGRPARRSGARWSGWAVAAACLLVAAAAILLKPGSSTSRGLVAGPVPGGSLLPQVTTDTVALRLEAADRVVDHLRLSSTIAASVGARGTNAPGGIQLRCDVLGLGTTDAHGAHE